MTHPFRFALGTLTVALLALTLAIAPVGGSVAPAIASSALTVNNVPTNVQKNQSHVFSVSLGSSLTAADFNVVMSVEAGTLEVSLAGGGSALFGYVVQGQREVGFSGTRAQVVTALGSITWAAPDTYSDFDFTIDVVETAGAETFYWPGDGTADSARYYKYVAGLINWENALINASAGANTLMGIGGYLARPSSYEENQFVGSRVDASDIWIAARRGTTTLTSGTTAEQQADKDWYWATDTRTFAENGPSDREKNTKFYREEWHGGEWTSSSEDFFDELTGVRQNTRWRTAPADASTFVNPWTNGEPNGATGAYVEWYVATNYLGVKAKWNDFTRVREAGGYLVEYNATQMTLQRSTGGTATFKTAQAPTQVTSLVATVGVGTVDLSWVAPAANGSPITSYTIDYADNSSFSSPITAATGSALTSTTLSSINNQVPYYFRVTAVNSAGAGPVSSTVFVKGAQAITWSPTTQLVLADSGLSLSAVLSAGNGTLGFIVVSAGTTGCAVPAGTSTLTFSSIGSGDDGCVVRPSSTSTSLFEAKTDAGTVTFDVAAALASTPPASSGGGVGSTPGGSTVAPVAPTAPPVAPISPRIVTPQSTPELPELLQGPAVVSGRGLNLTTGPRATIGGASARVFEKPLPGGISIETGGVRLGLSNPGLTFSSGSKSTGLNVVSGQTTVINGGGLMPGSHLQVWLPGRSGPNLKELARILVKSDGSFESDVSFAHRLGETPLPIGRQVLQVTGYDDLGRATVVELTVNIAQGAPNPEPNRVANALPSLGAGVSLATSSGIPEAVVVTAVPERREVDIVSGDWSFNVALSDGAGSVERIPTGATITLVQAETAVVSGVGFQPETRVDIWLFSEPTLLGSVEVTADGTFTGEVYLDARFVVIGGHTLQLQGVAADGYVKAANVGVVVNEAPLFTATSAFALMSWLGGGLLFVALIMFLVAAAKHRKGGRDSNFGVVPRVTNVRAERPRVIPYIFRLKDGIGQKNGK